MGSAGILPSVKGWTDTADRGEAARFERLWQRLEGLEFPVHSLMACRQGVCLWETYAPPYGPDRLHRMFSVTKSFCSLAVGRLAAAGRLSLDDRIVSCFPEYLPEKVHPWLADMTIRDMLRMQTCHSATTYKLHPENNWVESFFVTPPSHKSGQIFLYDTSASHTLAALVKKLTGQGVLDYLRGEFLDEIGFSKEAYLLCDPFGAELGGSGLMAKPRDLMVTAQYVLEQVLRGTGAFADYLREATAFQVPTVHSGQTLEERLGYGYQFWQVRHGFAMYGMGGQYALMYPDRGLAVVITADSQNIKGGTQRILDAVNEALNGSAPARPDSAPAEPAPREASARLASYAGSYRLHPGKGGFTALALRADADGSGGTLCLTRPDAVFEIPFAWGSAQRPCVLAKYACEAVSSARWVGPDSLLVYTQLCGANVGSLTFMLRLRGGGLTLWMRKIEETEFGEFCDFAEGEKV